MKTNEEILWHNAFHRAVYCQNCTSSQAAELANKFLEDYVERQRTCEPQSPPNPNTLCS